jgi:hypothetical protein
MTYYKATALPRSFKIPKINFLDKSIFNKHRRDISTYYYFAIERAQARLDAKLEVLQQEYDDYVTQIHQTLKTVVDVPFSRSRFVAHNIRGCHCKFCSTWSQHRWFCHCLQEVSDKRRLATDQYNADWSYLAALRTKKQKDLERLRDMQLADKRAAEIRNMK